MKYQGAIAGILIFMSFGVVVWTAYRNKPLETIRCLLILSFMLLFLMCLTYFSRIIARQDKGEPGVQMQWVDAVHFYDLEKRVNKLEHHRHSYSGDIKLDTN